MLYSITDAFVFGVFILAVLILVAWLIMKPRKRNRQIVALPDKYKQLLIDNVAFYRRLDEAGKLDFENRVQHFLSSVRVNGAGVEVEDIDRVLVGAGAIIPIYAFPDWEYLNIREVLLYPESFSEQFDTKGSNRSVLGMVGDGPMQQVMILSQHALREGFSNKTDKQNTAIHEFVHLIDKTDGATDGMPEVLLQNQYALPWLDMMHRNIKAIVADKSDINPYGATNQAEFFAVVSEYFFERPDLLKTKHPELFAMLDKIFARRQ
jgi:MtfA peptidase